MKWLGLILDNVQQPKIDWTTGSAGVPHNVQLYTIVLVGVQIGFLKQLQVPESPKCVPLHYTWGAFESGGRHKGPPSTKRDI